MNPRSLIHGLAQRSSQVDMLILNFRGMLRMNGNDSAVSLIAPPVHVRLDVYRDVAAAGRRGYRRQCGMADAVESRRPGRLPVTAAHTNNYVQIEKLLQLLHRNAWLKLLFLHVTFPFGVISGARSRSNNAGGTPAVPGGVPWSCRHLQQFILHVGIHVFTTGLQALVFIFLGSSGFLKPFFDLLFC